MRPRVFPVSLRGGTSFSECRVPGSFLRLATVYSGTTGNEWQKYSLAFRVRVCACDYRGMIRTSGHPTGLRLFPPLHGLSGLDPGCLPSQTGLFHDGIGAGSIRHLPRGHLAM